MLPSTIQPDRSTFPTAGDHPSADKPSNQVSVQQSLTGCNQARVHGRKISQRPHPNQKAPTQNLEMAHPHPISFKVCVRPLSSFLALIQSQESAFGSEESEMSEKEPVHDPVRAKSSALPARKIPSSSSTIPTFVTMGNRASGTGHQTIFAPTCQDIDARHEENITDGNATQYIGKVEIVPSLSQKEGLGGMTKQEENAHGKKRFLYFTRSNKAVQNAIQSIFVPQTQTSNITHEQNISEDDAHQYIGNDPNLQPPATVSSEAIPSPSPTALPQGKEKLFGRSKNSKV